MNVDIGDETPIFLFWEYLFQNFGILSLQRMGVLLYVLKSSVHAHAGREFELTSYRLGVRSSDQMAS